METLLDFVKVLGLVTLSFILLALIFGIVEGTINYIKSKKAKKEFSDNMKNLFDEIIPEILEEIAEEAKEDAKKEAKKTAKKATRKPRKPKENKEEDK